MATKNKNTQTKKLTNKKEINAQVNEERIIKPKNYIIVFSLFVLTVFLVLLLRHWYNAYKDYQLTIPILKDKITEVTVEELDTFLAENLEPIVYIEVSEEENSREIAQNLIEVIKKRNLTERAVYVNLSSIDDKESFFADFTAKYMEKEKLTHYPAVVVFSEGKVLAFRSRTDKQPLNIGDVEQMFDEYELEGE